MISLLAYAKINLFLDIVSREANGYHYLQTVMQSVELYDRLTFELPCDLQGINITCSDSSLPTDERNICFKAAKAFFSYIKKDYPLNIHIEKHIPSSAGMGGGSADGAGTLVALNTLTSAALSVDELCEIGATVGADLPFCIKGGTLHMVRFGDKVARALPTPDLFVLIAKPKSGVSTPMAYSSLDSIYNGFNDYSPRDIQPMIDAILLSDNSLIKANLFNIFDSAMQYCNLESKALLDYLRDSGSSALLSGSGSTVFALFDDYSAANKMALAVQEKYQDYFVAVCKTANNGIKILD